MPSSPMARATTRRGCTALFRYGGERTQLAPYSGSMGYGVPSAVAAKLVHPQRIVVSWNGDGCFLMNGQELATAVQYGLAIVFVVIDNGMYGTIRMHQERHYPGARVRHGPRQSRISRRWRARTARTARRSPRPMNSRRRSSARSRAGAPSLLHVKLDPQALTMSASLDATARAGHCGGGAARAWRCAFLTPAQCVT